MPRSPKIQEALDARDALAAALEPVCARLDITWELD